MNREIVNKYFIEFVNDNLIENIKEYFLEFEKRDIFYHTLEVVDEIKKVAKTFNIEKEKCIIAAYLHDVGRVVDEEELILFCEMLGQTVEEQEKIFPSILHQKASRVIAEKLFKIEDIQILNAIECHTTLKGNPSEIDMAVFLADKLSWKEDEYQDLIRKMRSVLKYSKERAILCYQEYLYSKRESLLCYHKWSMEAYSYFNNILSHTIT